MVWLLGLDQVGNDGRSQLVEVVQGHLLLVLGSCESQLGSGSAHSNIIVILLSHTKLIVINWASPRQQLSFRRSLHSDQTMQLRMRDWHIKQKQARIILKQQMLQDSPRRSRNAENPHSSNNSKLKLIALLKRIAELELRQDRLLEKIKYLEAVNLRLVAEQHQQLQVMNYHPTQEIQSLIKSLQSEIKRLSLSASDQERQVWIKKHDEVVDRSNKALQSEKQKRLELEFQLRTRAGSQNNSHLQVENQRLTRELQECLGRNQQIESEYTRLQNEIGGKFQLLDDQISLYQKEREESLSRINRLQEQLKFRQSCDGFSFSYNKQSAAAQTQTQEQHQSMDLSCYKSSIESLLEENSRLKRSICTLQVIALQGGRQIPKEIQIELSLSRRISS